MRDREPRPQDGAPGGVKRHQPLWNANVQLSGQSVGKIGSNLGRAEMRAFLQRMRHTHNVEALAKCECQVGAPKMVNSA